MGKKVTFVDDGDNWVGLYVNGELVESGHTLHYTDVLDALGIKYETIRPDNEWLADVSRLPANLKNVKRAKPE